MKKFILFSIIIYLAGLIAAFLLREDFLFIKSNQLSIDINALSTQSREQIFIIILKNNSIVFFTGICGFLTLGLLTVLVTFYNGFVFGYLIITINRFYGVSMIEENIMPHSIEIVGLLISSTLGFYLSSLIIKRFFFNKTILIDWRRAILLFIAGYSFILIGAIIEAYVSAK